MQRTSDYDTKYYDDENKHWQTGYGCQSDPNPRHTSRAALRATHPTEPHTDASGASLTDEWESRPVVAQSVCSGRRT